MWIENMNGDMIVKASEISDVRIMRFNNAFRLVAGTTYGDLFTLYEAMDYDKVKKQYEDLLDELMKEEIIFTFN